MHITPTHVYMLSMVYMIAYPPFHFLANYCIDKKGLRVGLNIAAIITIIGAATRCITPLGYSAIIVGQTLCAIGQPFIMNAVAKLANEWFEPNRVFL